MKRSTILLLSALIVLALSGCGKDGSNGAPGPQGDPGPPGPSGDVATVLTSGMAESGTTSTLTDTGAAWAPDQYQGQAVRIASGTGSGQSRQVLSNTGDTLTVTKFWDTLPDATSEYEIVTMPSAFEPTAAVEACVGCHGAGQVRPVGNIHDTMDAHYVDTDANGPLRESGYRQLLIDVTSVDVSRTVDADSLIIDFEVTGITANGMMMPVLNILQSDGRFTIARLNPGAIVQDSSFWQSLITRVRSGAVQADSERFSNGSFVNNNDGSYRYVSDFDPATAPTGVAPIAQGDTMRVAIQLSAGDLPPGNGWCDFDASLAGASACGSATRTRDIVQTDSCNGCHGVTPDTKLRLHGSRTEVEYCVTCHNPGSTDGDSGNTVDLKVMIHKIHYGSSLDNQPYVVGGHDYSTVSFTKDIDDCTVCHENTGDPGAGANAQNWSTVPTIETCGSCHDGLDITSPTTTHGGNQQTNNALCVNCHPRMPVNPTDFPVETVHRGAVRRDEGGLYAGMGNGYLAEIVDYEPSSRTLTVDYSVTRDGMKMDLGNDAEWTAPGGASRLALVVGWNTEPDYDNAGSGSDPALPISINALNLSDPRISDQGGGIYRATVALPSAAAAGSVTVGLEGHPAADLDGDSVYSDRIAVRNSFDTVDATPRASGLELRREIVDIAKCNQCHDAAGNGLSLHGNNRTSEIDVCVLCHNGNATDINRRPAQPATTADGKAEETIHFRRMIHLIHSGGDLQDGVVVYGFGGSVNDFSHVEFIGNRQNCETCHIPDTYSVEAAQQEGLPTTIDTGDDLGDPDDDLNISPAASVCSSCHDGSAAKDHMKLHGASFRALDDDIH